MKILYLLPFLPQLLAAQTLDVRYNQLGDSEKNIANVTSVMVQTSPALNFKLQRIDARDMVGTTPVNMVTMQTSHKIRALTLGQTVGAATFTNSTELLFTTVIQKDYVWSQKHPYNLRLAYDRNVFGIVPNQLRNEIINTAVEADAEIFIKNKVWVRTFAQHGQFSDQNVRNILQLDARHYMPTGVFYGTSIYHQTFQNDVTQDLITRERMYWSPNRFISAEGQVGYKFPWNHTKFAGISYVGMGRQKIHNIPSQNIYKIHGQLMYKFTEHNSIGVWGNVSNNASNLNGPGYRWGTLGTSVQVTF